jgi:uncharacterized cupredoxin-like copper-binding protein
VTGSVRQGASLRASARLAVLAACGAAAWWLLAGPATADRRAGWAPRTTVVDVTLGKPSEFGITLSKLSSLPLGTVVFKVTNRGKAPHDFRVCAAVAKTTAKSSCRGKATRILDAGQSATLVVTFKRLGMYEFLCDLAGHAGLGMKGLLGVGVTVAPAVTALAGSGGGQGTSGAVASSGATTPGAGPGATCATPDRLTTVTVELSEYSIDFLQQRIPCGTVTFLETNDGTLDHDVDLLGVPGGAGPVIHPGDKARFTVSLAPGTYEAQCDVPGHAALGMVGQITVTG